MKVIIRTTLNKTFEIDDSYKQLERFPSVLFSIDYELRGCSWNLAQAFRLAGNEPAIHLEDDLILCDDFCNKVIDEIRRRPKNILSFFSRKKNLRETTKKNGFWNIYTHCFYYPGFKNSEVADFIEFYNSNDTAKKEAIGTACDLQLSDYAMRNGLDNYLIFPALVQHRRVPTRCKKPRNTARQTTYFIDDLITGG